MFLNCMSSMIAGHTNLFIFIGKVLNGEASSYFFIFMFICHVSNRAVV